MEAKTMTMDLAGREFKITTGPIETYASGYAIVSLGDTVVMGNASMSEKGKPGAAWFPMFVDYEENMYAAGKIKGSRFIKRPGRPSENSILISRLIDRPCRPLFPKGTTNEVQIICSALSADLEVNPGATAINAASMALMLSGAPFEGPIGAVRMGYLDGKLIVNPTYEEVENGILDLVVAGTMDAITMVEAAANEISEDVLLEALAMAHTYIKQICQMQIDFAAQYEITPIKAAIVEKDATMVEKVTGLVTAEMLAGVSGVTKMEVKHKLHEIEETVLAAFTAELEEGTVSEGEIKDTINSLFEKSMRKKILEQEIRLDGRKLTDVRPISVVPDVLPRPHGSVIFQRGETMALSITTLGAPGDVQVMDTLDDDKDRRYFHHYNFPPFAVGDIKPLRGASRREIGHGDLAERALIPVLPPKADFAYTIWVVSEIIRCNGSSSMASVCGSTLSLMAAGVPIRKPVAGIAMGLVMDKETGTYKILSDIQGMEDFAGDMDFKVTGTADGITALQMDIKIKGLQLSLLKEALAQSKEGRDFIMGEMLKVIPEVRTKMSQFAPMIISHRIDPDMIRVVIGKGGETIQAITKECGVEIDIEDEGIVSITAPDQESGDKALKWVKDLTALPEIGKVYDGKVVKVMDFGAFVEFMPGKDGLVHISELANHRVENVSDVVKEGDPLRVKLMKIDEKGRNNLSHKVTLTEGDDATPAPAAPASALSDAPAPEKSHSDDMPDDAKHTDEGRGTEGTAVPGTENVRKVNGE